ncbi:MAG: HlyD family secretion protein [Acidiferrobacterales bacterium]
MSADSTTAKKASKTETEGAPSERDVGQQRPEGSEEEPKAHVDEQKMDPVRKWTFIVLGVCVFFFVWYLVGDRLTPYTSQARVKSFIVPMAAEVSGVVEKIHVDDNQLVSGGDVLLQIVKQRYEIAVQSAKARLDEAGQTVGVDTAAIKSEGAKVLDMRARLQRAQQDYGRLKRIYDRDPGAVSKAQLEQAQTTVAQAESQVAAAQAELEKAKERLGRKGRDNVRIRAAVADLDKARLDLKKTTVRAPSNGMITNLRIDEGHYAKPGQPLMTFVSFDDVWIEAHFRENSLGNIKPGDRVEVLLDIQPGRIYPGQVESFGGGAQLQEGQVGGLAKVSGKSGWLREPQRFPVIIKFDESFGKDVKLGRRFGSQADVIVYTGDHMILNALGWLWIRLMSLLSYVY